MRTRKKRAGAGGARRIAFEPSLGYSRSMPTGKENARKPAVVFICALVYLLNPAANIALAWLESGKPFLEFALSTFSLVVDAREPRAIADAALWILAPIASIGILSVRGWGWIVLLVHSTTITALSLLDAKFAFRGLSSAVFVNFPFFAASAFYLLSDARPLYFNSRLRWWERRPRYRDAIRVGLDGGRYVMFDISEKGIFIADARAESRRIGEHLFARIDLGEEPVTAKLLIVRLHPGGGDYPAGFGARIVKMDGASRRRLDAYLRKLKEKGDDRKAAASDASGPVAASAQREQP